MHGFPYGNELAKQMTHFDFTNYLKYSLFVNIFIFSQNLRFCSNNLSSLNQLNALSAVKRLEGLTVVAEGNPITCLKSWRMFAIFRLSHLGLNRINGDEVLTIF